jgi:hypothetical protein
MRFLGFEWAEEKNWPRNGLGDFGQVWQLIRNSDLPVAMQYGVWPS